MKAKFRKRAMLHCTATSSTQHIKKLWSLNKKCKSYQANCGQKMKKNDKLRKTHKCKTFDIFIQKSLKIT